MSIACTDNSHLQAETPSLTIAAALCVVVTAAFAALSTDCLHWAILPVLLCGVIVGADAVDWLRGRLDVFDPAGLLGLFGLHLFFFAPLIHISQDFWLEDWSTVVDTPPLDWRPWVGWMALLNLAGLALYRRFSRAKHDSAPREHQAAPLGLPESLPYVWRLSRPRLVVVLFIFLGLTGAVQLLTIRHFGGLSGYITAYEDEGHRAFEGWGRLLLLSEAFPILAFMGFALWIRGRKIAASPLLCAGSLVVFLAVSLCFGGLRGSRAYTVWSLFWAAGILHYCWRPISRRTVFAGIALIVVFMYGYGFYKWGGKDSLRLVLNSRARANWVADTNKGFLRTVLFDMGRCDVHAYLLYRLVAIGDYQHAYGRTYLGAVAVFVPKSIWPNRPPGKIKEGTEIQYGQGTYAPRRFESVWCYGLGGETLLNFPPLFIPLAYGVLGACVGFVRRFTADLAHDDARIVMVPFLVAVCFHILVWDSDNVIVFCVKHASLPTMLLFFSVDRARWPARDMRPASPPLHGASSVVPQ